MDAQGGSWIRVGGVRFFASLAPWIVLSLIAILFQASESVLLPLGEIQGVPCTDQPGVIQYFAIPYALPPLGDLRFRPPAPFNRSYSANAVILSLGQPPACPQPDSMDNPPQSEDCLFLSIWAPANISALLPVRVFIHGGGFRYGHAMSTAINGCNAVRITHTIQVNIQYRLGPLGFLAHPQTMIESNTTGNWGLLDQQLALKWVNEYILYFGGDPDMIMLFGESAGAYSVGYHLTIPSSFGLFHSAIGESGSPLMIQSALQAYPTTSEYLSSLGCPTIDDETSIDCLRNISVDALVDAVPSSNQLYDTYTPYQVFFPVVDGTTIPFQPIECIKAGNFYKVPYLLGTNKDEGSTFVNSTISSSSFSFVDVLDYILTLFPKTNPQTILSLYPELVESAVEDDKAAKSLLEILWTDLFMKCPAQQSLRYAGSHGVPTYQYFWTHTSSCDAYMGWDPSLGAAHFSEVAYVFGTQFCNLTIGELAMSDLFLQAWSSMAAHLHPVLPPDRIWPVWNQTEELGVVIGGNFSEYFVVKPLGFNQKCDVINYVVKDNGVNHLGYAEE